MIEIISVRFKSGGKEYYFNPNGARFQEGDGVMWRPPGARSTPSASGGTP